MARRWQTKDKKDTPLDAELLEIVLHALGVHTFGKRALVGGWRNHYCTVGAHRICDRLVYLGWMRVLSHASDDTIYNTYGVTSAGITILRLTGWIIREP